MRREGPIVGARKSRLVGCFVAIGCFALFSISSAMASPTLYVRNQYEPARIAVDQGGEYHNVSIHGIAWAEWNQPVAIGHGTYTFQVCGGSSGPCANSVFYDEPALLKLSEITTCNGREDYSTLEVTSDGGAGNTLFKPFRISLGSCRARRHAKR
jgi:hypothetical protein